MGVLAHSCKNASMYSWEGGQELITLFPVSAEKSDFNMPAALWNGSIQIPKWVLMRPQNDFQIFQPTFTRHT